MFSASTAVYGYDDNKYITKIDFGVVPVGSVHKRSIAITNELKASPQFLFKIIKKINHIFKYLKTIIYLIIYYKIKYCEVQ